MKLVKWLLALLVLFGVLYFVTSVKMGGVTLLQRLTGGGDSDRIASTGANADTDSPTFSPKDVATDVHTAKEKHGLEKLIEKRLQHGSEQKQ